MPKRSSKSPAKNRKASSEGTQIFGVVTRLQARQRAAFVTPLPPTPGDDYYVPTGISPLKEGDLVEMTPTGLARGQPSARIDQILSNPNLVTLANDVVLKAHNVPRAWSKDISRLKLPAQVDERQASERTDYRDMPLATIDGSDARDFDDAVYCEQRSSGWHLVVAIADVGAYVRPGSPIDVEAQQRGTSVYLPQRVVPMLPAELSEGICSLNPEEDRLAVVCDMRLSETGAVVAAEFVEAVIRSHGRLTYREVGQFLEDGSLPGRSHELKESIAALNDASLAMGKAGQARGVLDFNSPEARVDINNGQPVRVLPLVQTAAHRLIERAMISANVEAAKFLEARGVQPLYRTHEQPRQEGIAKLAGQLKRFNLELPDQFRSPKDVQSVLERIRDRFDDTQVWEMALLTTMAQARYAPSRKGHFGLALQTYVHFTSPIRRYPDLIVHRQIKALLSGRSVEAFEPTDEVGDRLSAAERRAIAVERQVGNWLKAELVGKKRGRVFEGIVTGVEPFGLFVTLAEFDVSGLLHVSRLGYDYFEYEQGALVGVETRTRFEFGQRVFVTVNSVFPPLGRIDLRLSDPGMRRMNRRLRARS